MITKLMSIAVGVAALAVLPAASAQSSARERLRLSVFACPDAVNLRTEPSVTLSAAGRADSTLVLEHSSAEIYETDMDISPGRYAVYAQDGFCTGRSDFTVLPEHDRHITVILKQGRDFFDAHAYVAGTLPISGISSAYLQSNGGGSLPLLLDGGAYYGEHVLDGTYVLVLVFPNEGLQCRLPIKVVGDGAVFDVEASDIARSIGYVSRYFGKPEEFHLLWPRKIY